MITFFDNTLYAVSGIGAELKQKPIEKCEKLVLGGRYLWVEIAPIQVPVSRAGSCIAYNKVFIFGGRISKSQETDLI